MTRSMVRVRPAQINDLPRLVALARTDDLAGKIGANRATGHGGHPEGDAGTDPDGFVAQRFGALLNCDQPAIYVATDDVDGRVIGMLVLDDSDGGIVLPVPALVISYLLVDKDSRRRGAGRSLLSTALHVAEQRGIDHVVASATAGSRDGNRYLARLGFAPLVVRRIAPAAVLRRSLGMAEVPDRLAAMRRIRSARKVSRTAPLPRAIRRGA